MQIIQRQIELEIDLFSKLGVSIGIKNLLMIHEFAKPSTAGGGIWHKAMFTRSKASFNLDFSFSLTGCLTKAKKPNLPYYLPMIARKTSGFMPFSCALVGNETQTSCDCNRIILIIDYDREKWVSFSPGDAHLCLCVEF